jgi:FlaA1/EpsC-like NDP-sugar epimerase
MIFNKLINTSRSNKQFFIFFIDFFISIFSVYLAFSIRYETIFYPDKNTLLLIVLLSSIFIPLFILFKFYSIFFRFIEVEVIRKYFVAGFCLFILQTFVLIISRIIEIKFTLGISLTVGFISSLIFIIFLIFFRLSIFFLVRAYSFADKNSNKTILVGSVKNSQDFIKLVSSNLNFRFDSFLDLSENKSKAGGKFIDYKTFLRKVNNKEIQSIIFCSREDFDKIGKELVNKIIENQIKIKINNLNSRQLSNLDILSDINLEDLIDRGVNYYNCEGLKEIKNSNVLVTGGAGSIGSVLVLKILEFKPKKIVVLDISEINIYNLKESLTKVFNQKNIKTEIEYKLGSITNEKYLKFLFKNNKFDYVYNVAAYKHVNIVENNILESLNNNFFGFLNIAKNSIDFNVKKTILISTDKAVEPSNFMGLTKKLCELAVKYYATQSNAIFYAVRFGNVFESSGSAIPLFKKQISSGETITVTDKNATRYFMSIKEAVNLILETQEIAKTGKIYLFDMGNPIKIIDIVKKLIFLSGKKINSQGNSTNKYNDYINVKYIGLSKGEKLHEKLSSEKLIKTEKKLILEIKENKRFFAFNKFVKILRKHIDSSNEKELKKLVKKIT